MPTKQVAMHVEWYHWRFFGPGGSIRQLHQKMNRETAERSFFDRLIGLRFLEDVDDLKCERKELDDVVGFLGGFKLDGRGRGVVRCGT